MTDARWPRVKALFQAAVERPPAERAAFLAAATLTVIGGYTKLKQLQITDVDFTNPVEATMHANAFPFQLGDNQPFSNSPIAMWACAAPRST